MLQLGVTLIKKSLGDEAAAWGRKAEMKKEGGDAGRWFGVDFVAVLSVTPKNFSQDASPREENNNNGFDPKVFFRVPASFSFLRERSVRVIRSADWQVAGLPTGPRSAEKGGESNPCQLRPSDWPDTVHAAAEHRALSSGTQTPRNRELKSILLSRKKSPEILVGE